jgi:hypothetical protein
MQSLDNVFWYRLEKARVVYDTLTKSQGVYVTTSKKLRGANMEKWGSASFKEEVEKAQNEIFRQSGAETEVDGNLIIKWGGIGTHPHLTTSGKEGDGGSLFMSGCVGCEDRWKLFNSTFAKPWVGAVDGVIRLMVKVPKAALMNIGGDTLVSADCICRGDKDTLPGAIPWTWVVKMKWVRNPKFKEDGQEIGEGVIREIGRDPENWKQAVQLLREALKVNDK